MIRPHFQILKLLSETLLQSWGPCFYTAFDEPAHLIVIINLFSQCSKLVTIDTGTASADYFVFQGNWFRFLRQNPVKAAMYEIDFHSLEII